MRLRRVRILWYPGWSSVVLGGVLVRYGQSWDVLMVPKGISFTLVYHDAVLSVSCTRILRDRPVPFRVAVRRQFFSRALCNASVLPMEALAVHIQALFFATTGRVAGRGASVHSACLDAFRNEGPLHEFHLIDVNGVQTERAIQDGRRVHVRQHRQ